MSLYAECNHAAGSGRALARGHLNLILAGGGLNAAHEGDGAGLVGRRQVRRGGGDRLTIPQNLDSNAGGGTRRRRIDDNIQRDIITGREHSIERWSYFAAGEMQWVGG